MQSNMSCIMWADKKTKRMKKVSGKAGCNSYCLDVKLKQVKCRFHFGFSLIDCVNGSELVKFPKLDCATIAVPCGKINFSIEHLFCSCSLIVITDLTLLC